MIPTRLLSMSTPSAASIPTTSRPRARRRYTAYKPATPAPMTTASTSTAHPPCCATGRTDDEARTYRRDVRDELRDSWRNFREYDAPFTKKVGMVFSNNWKKVRTRQNCCGNLGQPGC